MSLCVYRNNSLQLLDPFFDDEDDMSDIVQPIPMQSTESNLPVVLRSSFAKCCASGVNTGVVVTVRALLPHLGRVAVTVALVVERPSSEFAKRHGVGVA